MVIIIVTVSLAPVIEL